MDEFRHDIKQAFARQQAQIGDVSGVAERMLRRATATRPRMAQLWPSMAGVALVLVAAVAVATSVVVRGLHPRSVTTHQPSPTPTVLTTATPVPIPLSAPLRVPTSTPVILFHDPVDFNQIDGITWDGSARGRVGGTSAPLTGITGNPAGTLYGTTRDIRDRSGAVVALVPSPAKGFPGTWADDGQHYCAMAYPSPVGQTGGVPATLQVTQVGQAPRSIVLIGRAYEQASISVAACSVAKDRAVVVQSGGQGVGAAQVWVVRLSTGRILWTRTYAGGASEVDIRASVDGQYIAEATSTCCPLMGASTAIYSPSGAVLGHVNGAVAAFSWDGTLAVVGNYGGPVSIIHWRDGTTVWTSASSARFYGALPEPGGQRIAISVLDPDHPQTGGWPPVDIDVVSPNGKVAELLANVMQ